MVIIDMDPPLLVAVLAASSNIERYSSVAPVALSRATSRLHARALIKTRTAEAMNSGSATPAIAIAGPLEAVIPTTLRTLAAAPGSIETIAAQPSPIPAPPRIPTARRISCRG